MSDLGDGRLASGALNIGEALRRSFSIFFGRFGFFFLIAFLWGVVGLIAQWLLATALGQPALNPLNVNPNVAAMGIDVWFFVGLGLGAVLNFLIIASMLTMIGYGVMSESYGRRVGFAETIAESAGRIWRAAMVMVLQLLIALALVLAASLIIGLIVGVVMALSGTSNPFSSGADATLRVAGTLVGAAAVIVILIVTIRLFVAAPAAVVEELGPVRSLFRSAELTRGSRWRIFGLFLLLTLILLLIGVASGLAIGALVFAQMQASSAGGAPNFAELGPVLLMFQGISAALGAVLNGFFMVLLFVVYLQLVGLRGGGVDPAQAVDAFQ